MVDRSDIEALAPVIVVHPLRVVDILPLPREFVMRLPRAVRISELAMLGPLVRRQASLECMHGG